MKKMLLETTPRLALGLLFLSGAIDGLWFVVTGAHLLMDPPVSDRGAQFEAALFAAEFFWPFMKLVELIASICLLTNRAPAFGLALLAPIMSVIVLFHIFLNPQGLPVAAMLVILGGLLVRAYAKRYAGLFSAGAGE